MFVINYANKRLSKSQHDFFLNWWYLSKEFLNKNKTETPTFAYWGLQFGNLFRYNTPYQSLVLFRAKNLCVKKCRKNWSARTNLITWKP
jgi:hypothetical protein